MVVRSLVLGIAAAGLLLVGPAAAADQSKSITATGVGTVKVVPTDRKSESSIEKAVDVARKAGIKLALKQAHEYAELYAKASGLTLGSVISVSDATSQGISGYGFYGGPPYGPFYGPFGPNKYCGILRQPVFKRVNGKRKIVGTKRVRRCLVPRIEATSLAVTYSAT